MKLSVRVITGLDGLPTTPFGARKWLARNNIPYSEEAGRFVFSLSDLPDDVRRAYLARDLSEKTLHPGEYDDEAHTRFLAASPWARGEAERRAAMMRLLVAPGAPTAWADRLALVHAKFGVKGACLASLKRYLKAVRGVDPINFAPALLPDRKGGSERKPITPDAWSFFMTTVQKAAPDFPLQQAWRDVRDVAAKRGWDWPSYPTVNRRWHELPLAQQLVARHGKDEANRRLAQPALRDKSGLGVLEWVSLNGRDLDFRVHYGDGQPVQATILLLVDVASNYILDFEVSKSENAPATVRLIRRTCERYGIFDRLYTDNGSAFAGHLVAGGSVHRFRNAGAKLQKVRPLGICDHLGIKLHFALPKNAQAKIAERTFAALSRVIDDRPEFAGAHTGHNPGEAPGGDPRPVPIEFAQDVLRREVHRYNRETGRRSQGARGRSYQAVFEAGLSARRRRQPTARQLYLAGLIYTPAAVDRWGRVTLDGWTHGGMETQDALMKHHGDGRRLLIGRDPSDFSAPARAFDEDGRLICEGIEAIKPGAYGSADGIRDAARNRKAARDLVARADAANACLDEDAFEAALADLPAPSPQAPGPERVVAGRSGGPLRDLPAKAVQRSEPVEMIPDEMLRNQDSAIAARLAAMGKKVV
ncbi:transposase domain-containing protein [Rhodovulum sp. DZ06]|uniref:transposase domain-containing protein n=1 Tax=Rhodovulum sp. DZ06 TaxID=3425126 RepID=UPI003D32BDE8